MTQTILLLYLGISTQIGHAVADAPCSHVNTATCTSYDLALRTVDGVEIKGTLYSRKNDHILIYCHRLLAGKNGKEVDLLRSVFLNEYDLLVYDSRGHKASFGKSTGGGDEILDLHAVLSFSRLRGYSRTVVLGAGMGGAVGLRTARIFGNIDALIVVSPSAFSPRMAPFLIRLTSDKTFDTPFGKVPLRLIADTRLGPRYSAGFPVDLPPPTTSVPTLIIQAENDPFVDMQRMKTLFRDFETDATFLLVPGRGHAEHLLNENTLNTARSFLERVFDARDTLTAEVGRTITDRHPSHRDSLTLPVGFVGDSPLPRYAIINELRTRLRATADTSAANRSDQREILNHLREILFLRGYTRATVSSSPDDHPLRPRISCPKIDSVQIEGNHWLSDSYLHGILQLGGDYYNSYEIDAAMRRLSSEPAIRASKYSVVDDSSGNVALHVLMEEHRPFNLGLATKFTDIDDFLGLSVSWNQLNPTAMQYEGAAMLGASTGELIHTHCVRGTYLSQNLQLRAQYFDIVKSRDDLDYMFTRQEVHERGGEFSSHYRISSESFIRLGIFGKKCDSPPISQDLPVSEGSTGGVTVKVDISGALPLQREPRFRWEHTFYYQSAGVGNIGDFNFEVYQFNARFRTHLTETHEMKTTVHGGWVSGEAPPQEHLSIGGMTTLPGYPDDSFVDTRMALASHMLCLSAASLFNETSVWHPVRVILSGHTGSVWPRHGTLSVDDLVSDLGIELDYDQTLRVGIAWPVGNGYGYSERVYIGWRTHVY